MLSGNETKREQAVIRLFSDLVRSSRDTRLTPASAHVPAQGRKESSEGIVHTHKSGKNFTGMG